MRDEFISEVMQRMLPHLDNRQLVDLQNTLNLVIQKYEVELVKDCNLENDGHKLIEEFISAKRVEGCSEKTLRYYLTTIENMSCSLKKDVRIIQTEDLRKYLTELLFEYRDNKVDAVVLGCTHYPFARKLIQEILGEKVQVFDGAEGTAREMKRRLQLAGLLENGGKPGAVRFENSLEGQENREKILLCEQLFTKIL